MIEINESIISKYISGQCTSEELAAVNKWVRQSSGNAAELFDMQMFYDEMKGAAMPESKITEAENRLMQRVAGERHSTRQVGLRRVMKYAAILFVIFVLGGAGWYTYNRYNLSENMLFVKAPANRERMVTLPDGTHVWLNKAASIKYAKTFEGNSRDVYLDGEAYFEVTKNPHKPFIVNSDVMSVRVLGTIFDFKIEKMKCSAEVSLIQGEVQVTGNNSEGMVILSPGQKAYLNGITKRLTVSNVDARLDAVWHDDKIPFDNANVSDIARTLEQLYGVRVYVDPHIDQSHTYSGVIKRRESIDSVLASLQNTLPVKYKVSGNKVELISHVR